MNDHIGPETRAIIEAIKEGNAKIIEAIKEEKKT